MSCPYAEVIGDPIAQSKSPAIHNYWLGKLEIDAEYRACHVTSDGLTDYFAQRRKDANWRGCNVTMPHKQAVMPLLDRLSPAAAQVGAVNAIYRVGDGSLTGANTDVDGVAEAVGDIDLAGQDVCVIGAGGAARAAFQFLANSGCASVLVWARDPEKALRVAKEFPLLAAGVPLEPGSAALCEAELLINATQLGMVGQPPMPDFVFDELRELSRDALVFEMVTAPFDTELLKAARGLGLRTSDGLSMLIGQAAVAFEKFFGAPAPRDDGDAELRKLLGA